jgi:hypothetical protein
MLALSIWALDERATATANARDAVTEKERAETEKERALQGMF